MTARELLDWTRRLHIWVGLPCSVALVVFGITGLAVTAWRAPGSEAPPAVVRDVAYPVVPGTDREQLAGDVHSFLALPLTRRLPNWALGADGAGHLRMVFNTINADHVVTVYEDEGRIRVESTPVPLALFVDRLHTHTPPTRLRGVDPRLFLWSLYMEYSIFALIFLSISGGYLWLATRPRHRVAQISAALGLALLVTIAVTLA